MNRTKRVPISQPAPGWLRRQDAVYIFSMTALTFDSHVRPKIAEEKWKRMGNTLWFDGRAVRAALDSGAARPLDRYRDARARLSELELEKRRGSLVDVAIINTWLDRMAARLRQAGEILRRDFGPAAHAVLAEALDDFQRMIDDSPTGDATPEQ